MKIVREVPLSRRRGHKISSNRDITINVRRKMNESKHVGQQNAKKKNQHQQSHKNKDRRSLGKRGGTREVLEGETLEGMEATRGAKKVKVGAREATGGAKE